MDVEPANAGTRVSRRRRWFVAGAAAAAVLVAGGVTALDLTGTAARATVDGSDEAPGGSGTTPGSSTTAPDSPVPATNSPETAPGNTDAAPGNSDTAPGTGSDKRPEWVPGPSEDALPLQARAPFIAAVNATVTGLEAVDGVAQGRGQVADKALRVEITLSNDTPESISVDTVVVQLYCGADQAPGVELSGPRLEPFGGSVGPGESVVGAYVFTCPEDERDHVQVTVNYSPTDRTVAFEGSAPRG